MARSVLKGFLSILGAKIIVLVLNVLVTPILVRLIGSSFYGDYAFILSLLGITMILVNAGIFDGTRKYIAENRDERNWEEHVIGFYLRIAIILAVVAAVGYGAIAWFGLAEQLFDLKFGIYLYLLGILIISRQAYSVARGGLMGLGLEEKSEPLNVLKKIAFGITGLSLAYIGYGVAGILIGHILASVLVAVLAFGILFKQMELWTVLERTPPRFPRSELLSFNSLSIILILLTASLYHVDILLLRPMAGSQETGIYKAALVLAGFLWFVPNVLQTILLHSSSEMWSNEDTERVTSVTSKATRFNLSLVLLLAIGLAALAKDFVPIYFGSEFEATILPLLLLLPGVVGFAVARPIFAAGQGKGELRILILATGTAALINLILNLVLIPRFGTAGAAIATSIGYGSMVVFHVMAARQIGFDPLDDLRLSRIVIVGLVSSPIIVGGASLIESSIISLLVIPPLGLVIYGLLSLYLKVISPREVSKIASRLPPPIPGLTNQVLSRFE